MRQPALAFPMIFLCMLLSAGVSYAEPSGRLDLTTERVVVFKDGHGLFVKRAGGVADDDGRLFTEEVPESAVLGTFWALPDGQRPLLSMTSGWVETVETRSTESTCTTLRELLRVNAGKRLTLELDDDRRLQGRLIELLERPAASSEPMAGARAVAAPMSSLSSNSIRELDSRVEVVDPPRETVREIVPQGGDLLVLDGDQGSLALPVASVRSVSGRELTTRIVREEQVTRRSKRLRFDFGKAAAGSRVSMRILYFSPGVRWIPTYRLEGALERSASLALQGEILNEVEEIDGAELDLVVGVPNFRFKEVVSPFVLEATLIHALRAAAPDLMGQRMSNTFSQRASEWRSDAPPAPPRPHVMELAPQLAAEGRQDLFVYSRPGIVLEKGARAAIALWRRDVAVSHVHTFDVELVRNARNGESRARRGEQRDAVDASPLKLSSHQVWHQIEMVNEGETPWTTGPVLLLRNLLPLAQELLTYTAPGGRTRVPVTVAVDVRGSHTEREVGREVNALRVNNTNYTRVRKEGTITLTNYKDEPVDLVATIGFGGKAESASVGGRIAVDDFRNGDWEDRSTPLNNHSDVTWKLTLEPGETKTLTYECSFYIG